MRAAPFAVLLSMLLMACPSDSLLGTDAGLEARPAEVDFGRVWAGHPARQVVTLQNRSRAEVSVTVAVAPPFSSPVTVLRVPGAGEAQLELVVEAAEPGTLEGTLKLQSERGELSLPLRAVALAPSACDTAHPCRPEHFDPHSGACVGDQRPDGTPCPESSACLVGATCQDGACVGEAVQCADGNPCTLDACDPVQGCVYVPGTPEQVCPEGEDPCKVPYCDPQTGCGLTDAVDGVACGPSDCATANVCIAGACKVVAVPEGAACGAESPCQGPGTCSNGQCFQPIPSALQPVWTHVPPDPIQLFFDGVADPQENLYWSECESQCKASDCPRCDTVSATRDGVIRWRSRIHHGGVVSAQDSVLRQFVQGDAVVTFLGSRLAVAQRRSDGQTLWLRNVVADHGAALFDPQVPQHERHFSIGLPGSDAHGRVVIPLEGTRISQGSATHAGLLVLALSAQSGATVWQHLGQGRYGRVASGLSGDAFVASDDPWLPGQQAPTYSVSAFTASGQERWQMPSAQAAYPAVFDHNLVLGGVQALDVVSGAPRWTHSPGSVTPSIVGAGRVWSLWWRPGVGAHQLTQWDLQSGLARWSLDLPQTEWAGDLVMTHDADVLMVRTFGDFVASEYLTSVSSQGQEQWSCPLPMLSHHAHLTPLEGRVVARVVHAKASIAAFDLPGLKLPAQGWVVWGGSPARNGRPR